MCWLTFPAQSLEAVARPRCSSWHGLRRSFSAPVLMRGVSRIAEASTRGTLEGVPPRRIPSTYVVDDVGHSLLDRQVGLGVILDPLGVVQDVPVGLLQIILFRDQHALTAVRG
jgi:hypothetical protein